MTRPSPPKKVVHRRPSPGRGGRTKGWKQASPKRGKERHRLPKSCLLDPVGERYPICDTKGRVDCRGVTSAKVRSKQYHDEKIYKKAVKAEKKYCSPKKSRKTPSPQRKRK